MYVIKGEPRLSAKGHEVFAEMHAESACNLRRAAAEQPESPDAPELLALAAGQEGASKGHAFRAEELRYDARGGMTEAQAMAASEARAEAVGELVGLIHGTLAAGVPFPVVQWSRDDMAEVQGEDWSATCAERSRLLGVLFARTVVTTIPPGWTRDYDDGLYWARARREGILVDDVDVLPAPETQANVRALIELRIAPPIVGPVVVSWETWDEPRKGDG